MDNVLIAEAAEEEYADSLSWYAESAHARKRQWPP